MLGRKHRCDNPEEIEHIASIEQQIASVIADSTMRGRKHRCDICSVVLRRSKIELVTSDVMHRAVRNGLNPWTTPGIDSSVIVSRTSADPKFLRIEWTNAALADRTDWGLCSSCAAAVNRVAASGEL
jgi:hypothetical protein